MGNPINLAGRMPQAGEKAPDFTLTAQDLSDIKLSDFAGHRLVLNIRFSHMILTLESGIQERDCTISIHD